jgi:hypothetical protein
MTTKIKIKKKSKSIIVNGIEYKPYKRSKEIFLEHQQEHLEDTNRRHIHFLNSIHEEKE